MFGWTAYASSKPMGSVFSQYAKVPPYLAEDDALVVLSGTVDVTPGEVVVAEDGTTEVVPGAQDAINMPRTATQLIKSRIFLFTASPSVSI